ncbi:type II toxin-antitoxin system HicA family toxin [Candidatus Kaiserbacteria bacterium]|nr:type II toxin-antitoxin system HicA family toxin [Candidatus Kaiserbacteria bacterium]
MKRAKLVAYLEEHGCLLYREGARHSVFVNMILRRTSAVPRHREIKDMLAYEICKDLGIPKIKRGK